MVTDRLVYPWSKSPAKHPKDLPPSLLIIEAVNKIENKGGSKFLDDLLHQNDLRGPKFLVTSRPDILVLSHFASR